MGANAKQALGILIFLLAFTVLAGSFAGGGFLLAVLGLVLLVASVAVFLKCKPLEYEDRAR